MNENYEISSLKNHSFAEIAECFNVAFSDYFLKTEMNEQRFKSYCLSNHVALELSIGAFLNGKMVGFILNATDTYQNKRVIYDAGTGVIKEARGEHLLDTMFDAVIGLCKEQGITHYYLEVLQNNDKALYLYKNRGFQICRNYNLYMGDFVAPFNPNEIVVKQLEPDDTLNLQAMYLYEPSFPCTKNTLLRNISLYNIYHYYIHEKKVAYVIATKTNHVVMQLGCLKGNEHQLESLLGYISQFSHNLSIFNVDDSCTFLVDSLANHHLTLYAKQYEMYYEIK
ncbi:MAG: GNAT family N-acetyltransferase [Bacilli bacterium]